MKAFSGTVSVAFLAILWAGCGPEPTPVFPGTGRVEFSSSHRGLESGFRWAKAQALEYTFEGDPVGMWFEAALPGREAFCMRDVSHQIRGAMVLGLRPHAMNMFRKFAAGVSESRDWAGFWEINRHGEPAPVDYRNDDDFWYNLPANFDLLQAMAQAYDWTGDWAYLDDPLFLAFYRHSMTDYVLAWDPDGDGIMESPPENGIRGIPTYWEGEGPRAETGGDLVAAQFAANEAYGRILRLRGEGVAAERFEREARRLQRVYNEEWWNPAAGRFYTAILPGGSFDDSPLPLGQIYPLHFGIVREGPRRERMVADLPSGGMVELNSYLPDILFRNGDYARALEALLAQLDPGLERREYPEVSFTAVGDIVGGLMGVRPRASQGVLETKPRLPNDTMWTDVSHLPVMENEIHLRHLGTRESRLRNETGPSLTWRATFPGIHAALLVNGREEEAKVRHRPGEGPESWVEVTVPPGGEAVVALVENG